MKLQNHPSQLQILFEEKKRETGIEEREPNGELWV
jgi:hypothetical protein